MKRVLYEFLRFYVRIGLKFYFSRIEIRNLENIPRDEPILFTSNHQNAFLDALLIVCFSHRYTYFLARASIFSHPLAKKLLSLINIMPIYRIRDGKRTLINNQEIFQQCYKILQEGNAILIFPEGNHEMKRMLRPLSKGFTRIAYGALENSPLSDLRIVPVGINYEHHQKYQRRVSVIFDKPINTTHFDAEDPRKLREVVSERMKELITHIDSDEYEKVVSNLKNANADFLEPREINEQLRTGEIKLSKKKKVNIVLRALYPLSYLNNLLVIIFWKVFSGKIEDPVFIGSIKFTYGLFVVPVIYLAQSLLIFFLAGGIWAGVYLLLSIVTAPVLGRINGS